MNIKQKRILLQKQRHQIYVMRNKFIDSQHKDNFNISNKGILGCWFYIICEEILTILINGLSGLEEYLHNK